MQEDDSKTIEKRISENTKVIFRNSTNVKFQQLKNAISKDKLRPHLSGVFLDLRNEKIVVTNSHVLIAYQIEIIREDEGLQEGAILDPKIFNQANWLSVPKEDLELVEFHVTKEKTEVMLGEDIVAVAKNIDAESSFPQWKHVLTDHEEKTDFVAGIGILKNLISSIPPNFGFPKFHVGKKITLEAEIDDPDFGLIKILGLAMTIGFDEEEITNKSVEINIEYEHDGTVGEKIKKQLIGKKTSKRVLISWKEDFVDEDNGEVVQIDRNEIIVDKNVLIDDDVFDFIISRNAKSVFVHKTI